MRNAISLRADQTEKFSGYISLDLRNKIYQLKALDLIARFWPKRKRTQILEVGCADGSFINLLAQNLNAEPHGIDISPISIKLARKNGVRGRVHDLSLRLPYPDNSFDLVLALEVIEHLFDTDFFLSEIRRVTKKNGLIVLSTPNLASLTNRLKLLFGLYPKYLEYSRMGAGHIHLYTRNILTLQLNQHQLKIKVATSPNFFCPFITKGWFPTILRSLAMKLGDFFPSLGSHLLVVTQK